MKEKRIVIAGYPVVFERLGVKLGCQRFSYGEVFKVIENLVRKSRYKFSNLSWLRSGTPFVAVLKGVKITGKLHVSKGRVWLCQNEFIGNLASNTHGYKYSWAVLGGSTAELSIAHVSDISVKYEGVFEHVDKSKVLTMRLGDRTVTMLPGAVILNERYTATNDEIRRLAKEIIRRKNALVKTIKNNTI